KVVIKKRRTASPKKPNSAVRKVAVATDKKGRKMVVYLPGENNPLPEFASVLVRHGRKKDLPGVKTVVILGAAEAAGIDKRRQGRSKYGAKKPK
ncbi:MAG: 30S ribosomal protein S12, partial [Pseudomonadota bacterium]